MPHSLVIIHFYPGDLSRTKIQGGHCADAVGANERFIVETTHSTYRSEEPSCCVSCGHRWAIWFWHCLRNVRPTNNNSSNNTLQRYLLFHAKIVPCPDLDPQQQLLFFNAINHTKLIDGKHLVPRYWTLDTESCTIFG